MHLGDWLAQQPQPRGAMQRLARLVQRSPKTIAAIADGDRTPTWSIARRISAATNGEVTIAELLPHLQLGDWLAQQPQGTELELARLTGLLPQTITKIARGKPMLAYSKAQLISEATGGAVSVDKLLPRSPFGVWLARQPIGTRQCIAHVTGLWPNTITDIALGKRAPVYETARLISTATDGVVTVDELMQSTSAPTKAMSKRAQRRRLRAQRIEASDRPNDDARD